MSTATDDVNTSRRFITEKAKFLEGTVQGRRIRQWGQSKKTSSAARTNMDSGEVSKEGNENNNIGRSTSLTVARNVNGFGSILLKSNDTTKTNKD